MATARQIAANQQNAQKSTGPITDEGKAISRANALTHGLAGMGDAVADVDQAVVEQRLRDWRSSFQPATTDDEWTFRELVACSVAIDRCHRQASSLRVHEAHRARLCWDDDRKADAEEIAARLGRNPGLVTSRLRRTKQGCRWLIERWQMLIKALDGGAEWTEARQGLADDLAGTEGDIIGVADQADDRPVRDLDRLGLAGRAGGEHHVGGGVGCRVPGVEWGAGGEVERG